MTVVSPKGNRVVFSRDHLIRIGVLQDILSLASMEVEDDGEIGLRWYVSRAEVAVDKRWNW